MKIAHLCNYAPNESGMYGTVKDLVLAEIEAGHDAGMVDTVANISQYGIDGFMPEPLSFGDDADIICWHHAMNETWLNNKRKNIVMFLHGTPEFSFHTELSGTDRPLSVIVGAANLDVPAAFVTFWKRHVPFWEYLLDRPVHCIQPPADLEHFPVSERRPKDNVIKLAIVDYWRLTREPFQLLTAVDVLRKMQKIRVQLDIWGALNPLPDVWKVALQRLADAGVLRLHDRTLTPWSDIYDKTDVVLTMAAEETRVVREATSSGVPVVRGRIGDILISGYCCDASDAKKCAETILEAYTERVKHPEQCVALHVDAVNFFSSEESVAQLIPIFEKVLEDRPEEDKLAHEDEKLVKLVGSGGTDVIVLSHHQPEMTGVCLKTLGKSLAPGLDRLLWIDNGSTDEEHEQIQAAMPDGGTSFGSSLLIPIRSEENRGFAAGANLGIRQSLVDQRCEYIALVNNDAVVYPGWLAKLIKAMDVYRFSAICPLTNGAQPTGMLTINKLLGENTSAELPKELVTAANEPENGGSVNVALWERYGSRCYICNKMLSFFCCVIRRRAFEEVGLLDERLFAYGEDNDFFARARQSKLTFGVALGVYVYHEGAVTAGMLPGGSENLKQRAKEYLEKKHGK